MVEDDIRWLWAAYRKGAFAFIPRDLDANEFKEATYRLIADQSAVYLVFAPTLKPDMPIGLVTMRDDRHENFETHVHWFPWASPRNKVEATVRFMHEVGRRVQIFVYSEMATKTFFEHVMDHGVLARVGHIPHFFKDGEPTMMFRSRVEK